MGKFKRRHTARLQQGRESCDEIIDVGHVGKHVVGSSQVGLAVGSGELLSKRSAEEFADAKAHMKRHGGKHGMKSWRGKGCQDEG